MARRNKTPRGQSKGTKTDEQNKLNDWKRQRDRLFHAPTTEGIQEYFRNIGVEPPTNNLMLWAAFHKARTSARPMPLALRQCSLEWLARHGMKPGD